MERKKATVKDWIELIAYIIGALLILGVASFLLSFMFR